MGLNLFVWQNVYHFFNDRVQMQWGTSTFIPNQLNTFVKFNGEKYSTLSALFDKAGLGDLSLLKDKDFDIDTLQEANLDGVMDLICLYFGLFVSKFRNKVGGFYKQMEEGFLAVLSTLKCVWLCLSNLFET
jgi:hypothetical protein